MTELIQEIKEKQNITLEQLKQILGEKDQEKIQQLHEAAACTAEVKSPQSTLSGYPGT